MLLFQRIERLLAHLAIRYIDIRYRKIFVFPCCAWPQVSRRNADIIIPAAPELPNLSGIGSGLFESGFRGRMFA